MLLDSILALNYTVLSQPVKSDGPAGPEPIKPDNTVPTKPNSTVDLQSTVERTMPFAADEQHTLRCILMNAVPARSATTYKTCHEAIKSC